MNVDIVKEYLRLTAERKELEKQVEEKKDQARELEKQILDMFGAEGIDKISVEGKSVYPSRTFWPAAKEGLRDEMIATLKRMDPQWSYLVVETVNAQTLRARIIELDKAGEVGEDGLPKLPDELKNLINVNETFTLGIKKS